MAQPSYQLLQFDDLVGWADDNHQAALDVFLTTCGDMKDAQWQGLCNVAQDGQEARSFFERFFTPVLMDDGQDALFTGYFEPELRGSLTRGGPYQYPLYRLPSNPGQYSRREIEENNVYACYLLRNRKYKSDDKGKSQPRAEHCSYPVCQRWRHTMRTLHDICDLIIQRLIQR